MENNYFYDLPEDLQQMIYEKEHKMKMQDVFEEINSDEDLDEDYDPRFKAYKCCRDCDYTWDTEAYWEAGKGRVAFNDQYAGDIEAGDVVCSLCYKGEREYFPSDDEEEESDAEEEEED